jgi:hypothetical protein
VCLVGDGTQYYGYPVTAITSDNSSHDGLRGILGGFLNLFSCRKIATKSSGIPGFIFVKENSHKSSPWYHVLSDQAASD